jgi:hypothetical protein
VNTPVNVSRVPTRADIDQLQSEMIKLPQAELKTDHYFSGGMYCRRVFRAATTLIVGKVHKKDHLFICAAGEMLVWTETGVRRLQAGDVVESRAGTKRATLALTDSVGITCHLTDKTDLDEIEAELIEPDDAAVFDANNLLKAAQQIMELEGQS